MSREPTELEKAYISGIIDGEGHLYIEAQYGACTYPVCRVCNTDSRLPNLLQSIYGGSVQIGKAGARKSATYTWVYSGVERAARLYKDVAQYSIIKQEQWEIIGRYLRGYQTGKGRQGMPEGERERRSMLREELQNITRRSFNA